MNYVLCNVKQKVFFLLLLIVGVLSLGLVHASAYNQDVGGVGYTFLQTLPDYALAEGVANALNKSPNDIITQDDINNLYDLTLRSRNISNVQGLDKFTNLWSLDLSDNQISTLPQSFCNLTGLRVLILDDNRLTDIQYLPGNIGHLQAERNQIEIIPRIYNMTTVRLRDNPMQYLREPDGPSNLVWLDLTGLSLYRLSDKFTSNMPNLEYLYLSRTQLTALPESIGNMTKLIVLELEENQLTALPESMGKLINLKYLYLRDNQIKKIPSNIIEQVKNLKFLDFRVSWQGDVYLDSVPVNQSESLNHEGFIPNWINELLLDNQFSADLGRFHITKPNKSTIMMSGVDFDKFKFEEEGTYRVQYVPNIYKSIGGGNAIEARYSGYTTQVEVKPSTPKNKIYKLDVDSYSGTINSDENTITFSIPKEKVINGIYSAEIKGLEADTMFITTKENGLEIRKVVGDRIELSTGVQIYIEKDKIYTVNINLVETPIVYPEWNSKTYYHVGDIVTYDGILYKSLSNFQGYGDLSWNPKDEKSLWRKL